MNKHLEDFALIHVRQGNENNGSLKELNSAKTPTSTSIAVSRNYPEILKRGKTSL